MCGISGLINFDNIKVNDVNAIKLINDKISHRGPDAEGIYENDSIVFAHRRLSIIDLSDESNHPMHDDTGSICLVFNGEIYNYQDLRNELEGEYTFKTDHSDTETIIYAYRKWGIDCLKKFIGMFAFALYDKNINKVFLCRDRLGKKPIFYSNTESGLYFASESSALFASNAIKKEINEEAIYDYLTYLTIEAPNTFFKGVNKVEAGHFLEITREGVESKKYWDIADFININNVDDMGIAKNRTQLLLEKSMNYRNIADVPIAVALSGGLDSSLNACYSKKSTKHGVAAINISYKEKSQFDESEIAKKYSTELCLDYHGIKIDQADYKEWILEYFDVQKDTPIGDPNSPLLYGISKIAVEKGFKVLQVGEGGDEIGGYPVYTQLVKLHKLTRFIPRSIIRILSWFPIPVKFRRELEVLKDGGAVSRRFLFGFTDSEKRKFWKKSKHTPSMSKLTKYANEIRDDLKDSFLRKVINIEYKFRLAELILPRVDYPSMATSVEARSPFMDQSLIEYSAGLSWDLKMENGPKSVLRKVAENILPNYLMSQPKVGFGMLLTPFLQKELPKWFKRDIVDANSPIKSYVSDSFLRDIYMKQLKKGDEGYRMWVLYSLNIWLLKQ